MTKEISTIQKAKIVSRAVEEIQALKRNVVLNFLEIGKRLDDIQRNGYWACYADHLKNFDDFLKEIKMGRATAYNLMAIWRKFGEFLTSKNLDVDYFRLVKLLPVAGDAENEVKEEWLMKASELTLDGFEDEIRAWKNKPVQDECPHPIDRKILLAKCLDCGKTWKATKEEVEYAFKNLKK